MRRILINVLLMMILVAFATPVIAKADVLWEPQYDFFDDNDIKKTIRGTLEPFLYQKTKRNPIVIPVILNQKAAMEELQNKQMHRA